LSPVAKIVLNNIRMVALGGNPELSIKLTKYILTLTIVVVNTLVFYGNF
jgi:hypothetical protein